MGETTDIKGEECTEPGCKFCDPRNAGGVFGVFGPPASSQQPAIDRASTRPLVLYQAIGGRPSTYMQLPVLILLRQFFEPNAAAQLVYTPLDGHLQRRIAEQSTEAAMYRAGVVPLVGPWLEHHVLQPRCVFTGATTLFSHVDRGFGPPTRMPGTYSRARPSLYICLTAPPSGAMFFTPGYPISLIKMVPGDAVLVQSIADECFNTSPGDSTFLRLYGDPYPYAPPPPVHDPVIDPRLLLPQHRQPLQPPLSQIWLEDPRRDLMSHTPLRSLESSNQMAQTVEISGDVGGRQRGSLETLESAKEDSPEISRSFSTGMATEVKGKAKRKLEDMGDAPAAGTKRGGYRTEMRQTRSKFSKNSTTIMSASNTASRSLEATPPHRQPTPSD